MTSILAWVIVGGIAGFAASRVAGKGLGLLWDIAVGIVGAFLGGWLAGLAGISVSSGTLTLGGVVSAFIGAVILLLILRALTTRKLLRA